jgi:hypothetical protein
MKRILVTSFAAIVGLAIFSCSKTTVNPTNNLKVDTSKTLISDLRLVGNWDIVTDTISYGANKIKYVGSPGDYFKFTKYGNLYIAESLDHLVDTAIYAISSTTNQVAWQNLYTSINGSASTIPSTSLAFTITHVDTAKLVLTQSGTAQGGARYEQIIFKKHK